MSEVKRAALYTRISEKEKGVDKVADQEADLRKIADASGYLVAEVFTDDDKFAFKREDRPAWTRMLGALKAGKFDVIMASAPDRLARGDATALEALQVLCVRAGAVIHTKAAGVQDPSTPMVKALLRIQDTLGGWSRTSSRRSLPR